MKIKNSLTKEAKRIYDDLIADGYSNEDIRDAMEDGQYLAAEEIPQHIAEDIHTITQKFGEVI